MLVIRKKQFDILRQEQSRGFEEQLVDRFFKFYPVDCKALGRAQMRRFVKLGIDRAFAQGCERQRETGLFLLVMLSLGSYFDEDRQFPWAAEILADQDYTSMYDRIIQLYQSTLHFLDETVGEDNQHLTAAMKRIRKHNLELAAHVEADDLDEIDVADALRQMLATVYPRKSSFQGEKIVSRLVESGLSAARAYGITTHRGITVYVQLMFMLGSGFDRDPLFPWANQVFIGPSTVHGRSRADRLYYNAMRHLEQSLTKG